MTTEQMRELDAWLAEHCMGWQKCTLGHLEHAGRFALKGDSVFIHDRGNYVKEFHPTTDPAAAMMVLARCAEKCDESGDSVDVAFTKHSPLKWCVGRMEVGYGWEIKLESDADTLPLAICLFARKLFEKQTKQNHE